MRHRLAIVSTLSLAIAFPVLAQEGAVQLEFRLSSRPDFQVLVYPGLRPGLEAPKDAPRAFLICAFDNRRPAATVGTLLLIFRKVGVPAEVHVYARGGHGFGDLPDPPVESPSGIPSDYGEHMRIMFDILALAFQTDSTRIAALLLAGDGTNYAFPQIGIPEGHHYLTHQQRRSDEAVEKVAQIDQY